MAYLGPARIVVGVFVITPASVLPAPWALLPVLCTAAVITNPVMIYLGDNSYSLYLWHFPMSFGYRGAGSRYGEGIPGSAVARKQPPRCRR